VELNLGDKIIFFLIRRLEQPASCFAMEKEGTDDRRRRLMAAEHRETALRDCRKEIDPGVMF
jgi:hypothetical protein